MSDKYMEVNRLAVAINQHEVDIRVIADQIKDRHFRVVLEGLAQGASKLMSEANKIHVDVNEKLNP
jgi:hypothetical protein